MAEQKPTDFVPGTMDITEHKKTFNGFIHMATGACVLAGIVLIFMALSNA